MTIVEYHNKLIEFKKFLKQIQKEFNDKILCTYHNTYSDLTFSIHRSKIYKHGDFTVTKEIVQDDITYHVDDDIPEEIYSVFMDKIKNYIVR